MTLNALKPHPGSRHRRKRVGRGPGSGIGKTSGRGHKGQKARGPGPRAGFEGGQMPLMRILPKRGFTARSRATYRIVNIGNLERHEKNGVVEMPAKVLGSGDLKKALRVRVLAFSKSAREKIEKAGGTCEVMQTRGLKQNVTEEPK